MSDAELVSGTSASGPSGARIRSVIVAAPDNHGGKRLIATVELRHKSPDEYALEARGGRSATPDEIAALERHLAPVTSPQRREESIEVRWSEATAAIASAGWSVEEGTTDLSIKLTVSGRTGKVLAIQQRAHPLAEHASDTDDSIARRAREAIEKTFQSNAVENAEKLRDAIATGQLSELSALLREGALWARLMPQRLALDALRTLDVDTLDHDTALAVVELRLLLADGLRDFLGADRDMQRLLTLTGKETDPEWLVQLLIARGNSAGQRQLRESAGAHFRAALSATRPPGPLALAWAHRGLALLAERGSPEWENHEERAMDAFLVGGSFLEAMTSAVSLAQVRCRRDPNAALSLLEKASEWAGVDEPQGRDCVAAIVHERAKMLLDLQRFVEARKAAELAAELRNGLFGAEFARVASLELAAFAAQGMGDKNGADTLRSRAAVEHARHPDASSDLNRKVSEALQSGTWSEVAKLRDAIEASGDERLVIGFRCLEATMSAEMPLEDRLALLDSTQPLLASLPGRQADGIGQEVYASFALVYEKAGDLGRALDWHQRVLALNPRSSHSVGRAASLLLRLQRWDAAVAFAERNVTLFGRQAGWLRYLGEVLLRAGRPTEAFTILKEAEGFAKDPNAIAAIRKLREEAFDACSAPPKPPAAPAPGPSVSREQFEAALAEFGQFVSADKRMDFWKVGGRGARHEWLPSPEQRGKGLLQGFLRGKFGKLMDAFEEVRAGAGRIDLYLSFAGGLRVIVELKMCGGGYTTNYSLEGVDQLVHYLEQRGTGLGYLVVFDGRMELFGTGMPAAGPNGAKLIVPLCIDVRPVVVKVKRSKTGGATKPRKAKRRGR